MAVQDQSIDSSEDQAQESSGGKKTKFIVVGALAFVLLVSGGGAAAYFLGFFGVGNSDAGSIATDGDQHEGGGSPSSTHAGDRKADLERPQSASASHVDETSGSLVFVDLPEVLVNLQASGKRMRFLKMRVALEARGPIVANNIKKLMPRIMDSFQMYLRALTIDEVSNPASLHRLKEELTARANYAISPDRIDDVLVKELLVQ